jgi:transposase
MFLVGEERLKRHDLTDEEWARLEPLLPGGGVRGRPWADHRTVVNSVFHRVRVRCPWRDLPTGYGPWKTAYNRHRRWSGDGTWERVLDALRAGCDEEEGQEWTAAIDSTVVRAHQHAAGARHAPPKDIDAERLAPAALLAGRHTGGWGE